MTARKFADGQPVDILATGQRATVAGYEPTFAEWAEDVLVDYKDGKATCRQRVAESGLLAMGGEA